MAVDFTKQMKRDFTILAPDIFPTHMELLQEVFALHGYHVEVLHDEGPAVIAAGLKYLHNDMCYPATCAVGQQLYALTSGKYDPQGRAYPVSNGRRLPGVELHFPSAKSAPQHGHGLRPRHFAQLRRIRTLLRL